MAFTLANGKIFALEKIPLSPTKKPSMRLLGASNKTSFIFSMTAPVS